VIIINFELIVLTSSGQMDALAENEQTNKYTNEQKNLKKLETKKRFL